MERLTVYTLLPAVLLTILALCETVQNYIQYSIYPPGKSCGVDHVFNIIKHGYVIYFIVLIQKGLLMITLYEISEFKFWI